MSTIIIGDIHGCARALSRMLEKLDPSPRRDRLIFLGDLFDRGSESWEVWREVRSLADIFGDKFTLLRGNHEDYLLSEKLTFSQKRMWDRVGRQATIRSFKAHGHQMEETIPWLKEKCRDFYRDEVIQCVHAGLKTEPIEVNDAQTLFHDHDIAAQNHYSGRLTVTGHISLSAPTWFLGDGKTAEKLPVREERSLPEKGIICIDTGCGKGGRLTAMSVDAADEGAVYSLDSVSER